MIRSRSGGSCEEGELQFIEKPYPPQSPQLHTKRRGGEKDCTIYFTLMSFIFTFIFTCCETTNTNITSSYTATSAG
jgi:hypothetical protein